MHLIQRMPNLLDQNLKFILSDITKRLSGFSLRGKKPCIKILNIQKSTFTN